MLAEKYRAQMRSEEEANTSREKLFPDAVAALCKMRRSAGVEESLRCYSLDAAGVRQ